MNRTLVGFLLVIIFSTSGCAAITKGAKDNLVAESDTSVTESRISNGLTDKTLVFSVAELKF